MNWNYASNAPITLRGKNHLSMNETWRFQFEIDKNNLFNYIDSIHLQDYCNNQWYGNWEINSHIPFSLEENLTCNRTIYPKFIITSITSGMPSRFQFSFRPIVVSNYNPTFDARVARSIDPNDDWKINPIIQFLNNFGFDCSTLGREVKTRYNSDNHLMNAEKEWASLGDCLIGILVKRFNTQDHGMPTSWVHTEDGLSYSRGRPRFAIVEKGVQRDGSYKYLDPEHVIEFESDKPEKIYEESYKILNFRNECNKNKFHKHLNNLGSIALVGFGILGVAVTIDALLGHK
ncbi:MAG: hypothetical protein ACR2F1_13970 [Nitrososphaeraceae archaeon]